MFSIFIPGKIGTKQRPRKGKYGFYTPKETKVYERKVGMLCKQKMIKEGEVLTKKPVSIALTVYCKVPKSWNKNNKKMALERKILPTCKPDLDNVLKIILDSLNGIFYHDDSQVAIILDVRKFYAMESGVHIFIKVV